MSRQLAVPVGGGRRGRRRAAQQARQPLLWLDLSCCVKATPSSRESGAATTGPAAPPQHAFCEPGSIVRALPSAEMQPTTGAPQLTRCRAQSSWYRNEAECVGKRGIINNKTAPSGESKCIQEQKGANQLVRSSLPSPLRCAAALLPCRSPSGSATAQAIPASAGVLVMRDRAWTGERISTSRIWYTRRWRLTEVRPSKRDDTTSTSKWVSPLPPAV